MTLKLVKKIANNSDKMIVGGGIVTAVGVVASKANPAIATLGEGIALVGLMVAGTALIIGMAKSLSKAD